jgi:hypothetical protein
MDVGFVSERRRSWRRMWVCVVHELSHTHQLGVRLSFIDSIDWSVRTLSWFWRSGQWCGGSRLLTEGCGSTLARTAGSFHGESECHFPSRRTVLCVVAIDAGGQPPLGVGGTTQRSRICSIRERTMTSLRFTFSRIKWMDCIRAHPESAAVCFPDICPLGAARTRDAGCVAIRSPCPLQLLTTYYLDFAHHLARCNWPSLRSAGGGLWPRPPVEIVAIVAIPGYSATLVHCGSRDGHRRPKPQTSRSLPRNNRYLVQTARWMSTGDVSF